MSGDSLGQRKLPSWTGAFIEYTENVPSTERFRRWAAYSTVAGALQRHVWVTTREVRLFPSLYILLVGRPASGKTIAIGESSTFLRQLPKDVHLAPKSITRQKFYRELANCVKVIQFPDGTVEDAAAMTVAATEFSVFMRPGDIDFQHDLNDMYDGISPVFDVMTKQQGDDYISNPWVNIIGGTTPKDLQDLLSDRAFFTGFGSRLILIFDSAQAARQSLFTKAKKTKKLESALLHDIKQMVRMAGQFEWTDEGAKTADDWFLAGMKPIPGDPRLESYNGRRVIHFLKLCMVAAADTHNEMRITAEDVEYAKNILLEAESDMPKALEFFGDNPLARQVDVTYAAIAYLQKKRGGKPVPEHLVLQAIQREVDTRYLEHVIRALTTARQITIEVYDGRKCYAVSSEPQQP